jgi:hypothetical protein
MTHHPAGFPPPCLPPPRPRGPGPSCQVDVTTEDDGTDLENNGVRVAIGGSSNTVFGDGSYGGIAFGGFARRDRPAAGALAADAVPLRVRAAGVGGGRPRRGRAHFKAPGAWQAAQPYSPARPARALPSPAPLALARPPGPGSLLLWLDPLRPRLCFPRQPRRQQQGNRGGHLPRGRPPLRAAPRRRDGVQRLGAVLLRRPRQLGANHGGGSPGGGARVPGVG